MVPDSQGTISTYIFTELLESRKIKPSYFMKIRQIYRKKGNSEDHTEICVKTRANFVSPKRHPSLSLRSVCNVINYRSNATNLRSKKSSTALAKIPCGSV